MAYTLQTWTDGSAGNTPLNATRLGHMESGIAAAYGQIGTGAPPAASVTNQGTWWFDSAGVVWYYSDGAAWHSLSPAPITSFNTRTGAVVLTSGDVTTALGYTPPVAIDAVATDITASAPGDAKAAGAVAKPADAGHKHSREAWGLAADIGTGAFGTAAGAGATGKVADAGHSHATPATPATSVFGRTGAVVATTGDYTAAQVTNAADKSSASAQNFTGNVQAVAFVATGLTGATAASRYVGATATGAPATGTFAVGDFVVDHTGAIWVCTVLGTPGTWVKGGAVASVFGRTGAVVAASGDYTAAQVTNAADKSSASIQTFTGALATTAVGVSGLTGAVNPTRLVGGTGATGGHPTTGTFAVGDVSTDILNGAVWLCTVAGTPGTWVNTANAGTAGVSSFNGRTGAVAPAAADYTAAQVTNAADKSSASDQVFTGNVKAPAVVAAGLTGTTAASRYVGALATGGTPGSGTFAVGDHLIGQDATIWVCTAAGTPGTWVKVGAAAAGALLACVQYAPATNVAYVFSSTALAALDTTNLTVAFTAPASGAVLVRVTGGQINAQVGGQIVWGLFTHSTTTQVGVSEGSGGSSYEPGSTLRMAQKITGLTPGNSYQLDLAGFQGNGTTLNVQGATGTLNTGGPLLMEVLSA